MAQHKVNMASAFNEFCVTSIILLHNGMNSFLKQTHSDFYQRVMELVMSLRTVGGETVLIRFGILTVKNVRANGQGHGSYGSRCNNISGRF